MKSILIIKSSAIGDVVQTLPVLEYIKRKFPDSRVDWVVEKGSSSLLLAHPDLERVIVLDLKKWRKAPFERQTRDEVRAFTKKLREKEYDLLFDLQGNSKSGVLTLMARAKRKVGFGKTSVSEILNLLATDQKIDVPWTINVRQRYLQVVQTFFGDVVPFTPSGVKLVLSAADEERLKTLLPPKRPAYMVAFGSKWANKRLDDATLKDFLHLIAKEQNPYFLFVWGDPEEKTVAEELHLLFPKTSSVVGQMSLPLWQRLMGEVDLVIAMDSAALHLCGTTATPSFSVFGPSLADIFKPIGDNHVAVQGNCPYGKTFDQRCPILRSCKTGACMRSHSASTLFKIFKK